MTKKIKHFYLLPLCVALSAMVYFCLPYAKHLVDQWFVRDFETHAQVVFDSAEDQLEGALLAGNPDRIQRLFQRLTENGGYLAVGYCDARGELVYTSGRFPAGFHCNSGVAALAKPTVAPAQDAGNTALLAAEFPLQRTEKTAGTMVMLNDLNFIEQRHGEAQKAMLLFLLSVCLTATFLTIVMTNMILRGWLNTTRRLLQKEKDGDKTKQRDIPSELKPLVLALYQLLRRRHQHRQTVNPARTEWTADSLQAFLRAELPGEEVIVTSNREPYIHNERNGQIVLQTSAGGLVSAIDPVLRACKGTWIAHGSGTADKKTVDNRDRLEVPPEKPAYTLRRVWLSEEEEAGYCHGFSNEGLWPLCLLIFTRPIFRDEDWAHYQTVNRKFADAVVAEAKTKSPIILVQDYHLSLLPELIHERLPRAIVATFWHIPWPNAETFSICPWREEILKGMLSSDILGFHTQFHCNNFLDTVDRFLECRIDRERNTVTMGGRTVLVRPYPISIEWSPSAIADLPPAATCRANVLKQLNLPEGIKLGVGVERFDYTKGIMDRFQAVARFFRENPSWIGKLVFVQVAAPTRAMLKRYREVQEETLTMVETINVEFGHDTWKPIILIAEQYNQRQVFELFRAADFCIVSSLHDGMNLVAKEFVAARDDERGVLILSPFAGAAEELQEALIVNPHDTKGMADSIFRALRMNPEEQTQRMRLLRNTVRERTIYWWAGQMLMDVARVRKSGVILTEPTLAGGLRDLLSPRRAIGKLLQLNKNARSRAA